MTIERQADPKGDRVKLAMTGKFLPFKDEGATGNAQAYGYKEEWGAAAIAWVVEATSLPKLGGRPREWVGDH